MKEAGCFLLFFGIDSGSDKILKIMNKGFTSEQASKTLKESSEAGIKNIIFLMPGYPHETVEDIIQTKEFIKKNKRYICSTFIFKFSLTYGSPMYYNPEKFGVTNLRESSNFHFGFVFDECEGLPWEQKQKQQQYSQRQIEKTISKYTRFKNILFYWFMLFRLIIVKIKNICSLI